MKALLQNASPDFLGGAAAGTAGTLIAHPFDTVKTRGQESNINARDAFTQLRRDGGFRALYRGVSLPLVTGVPLNAVCFSIYGGTNQTLAQRGYSPAAAGVVAG